jgi:hypothetical protein
VVLAGVVTGVGVAGVLLLAAVLPGVGVLAGVVGLVAVDDAAVVLALSVLRPKLCRA